MKTLIVAGAALAVLAAPALADDQHIAKRTRMDREVQIRGFAEFDAHCRLKHVQTITVVDVPSHGRIEIRPGKVTIGDNWVGSKACNGTQLDGVRVWYVPEAGWRGTDRFTFDVGYLDHRNVRADVEVAVE